MAAPSEGRPLRAGGAELRECHAIQAQLHAQMMRAFPEHGLGERERLSMIPGVDQTQGRDRIARVVNEHLKCGWVWFRGSPGRSDQKLHARLKRQGPVFVKTFYSGSPLILLKIPD